MEIWERGNLEGEGGQSIGICDCRKSNSIGKWKSRKGEIWKGKGEINGARIRLAKKEISVTDKFGESYHNRRMDYVILVIKMGHV
jgi:hypothetical protein